MNHYQLMINMAMTMDGKSVLADGRWHSLTSKADRDNMDFLRSQADIIFASSKSLRQDNAKLYVRNNTAASHPKPVIFSQTGQLSPDLNLFQKPHPQPIIVGPKQIQNSLKKIPDELYNFYPWTGWQDLTELMHWLQNQYQCKTFLLEGGPQINAHFFQQNMVTDMYLTIVPFIAGGTGTGTVHYEKSMAQEHIFQHKAKLITCKNIDQEIFLHYSFLGSTPKLFS